LSFAASADLSGLAAAVGYYGGGIAKMLDKTPKVPLILHFGELDAHIPMSDVETIKAALPQVPVYTYHADHGFNCDARGSYDKAAAAAALEHTLDVFREHIG
jgi:carboxymethylenebutenolidase